MKPQLKATVPSLLVVLFASAMFSATADAAPVWTQSGANIQGDVNVALKQVGFLEVSFTEGTTRYTVSCATDNAARGGRLSATVPGTDKVFVFSIANNNCNVKLGNNSTGCSITLLRLMADSNSTLGGSGPSSFTDSFSNFELEVHIGTIAGMTCAPAGNYVMQGGASMTGTWSNSASQLTFNGVGVTLAAFTTPTFSTVYNFTSPGGRIGAGETKGEQPDWTVSGTVLATKTEDESYDESSSVELKSEKLTVKCGVVNGSGTITGGEPGTGSTDFALESCSDVSEGECAVSEPIDLAKVKTAPVILSKKEKEYGIKLESVAGTISLTGSKCATAGEYALEGNTVGLFGKSSEEIEFTEPAKEGSTLKLGGVGAKMVGKVKSSVTTADTVAEEEYPTISPIPSEASPLEYTASTGKTVLESGKSKVECKEGTQSGSFTGIRSGTITLTLHGCKSTGLACQSLGDKAETILASGTVQLVDLEKSKLVLGQEMALKELHVECGGGVTLILVKGAAIGEVSGLESGKGTKTGTAIYKQEKGKQTIKECHLAKAFCEGKKFSLETSINGGAFEESAIEAEEKVTLAKEATFGF